MGQRTSREPVLPTSVNTSQELPTTNEDIIFMIGYIQKRPLWIQYLYATAIYLPFFAINAYFLATDGACIAGHRVGLYFIGDTVIKVLTFILNLLLLKIFRNASNTEYGLSIHRLMLINIPDIIGTSILIIILILTILQIIWYMLGWFQFSANTFNHNDPCSFAFNVYIFVKLIAEPFIALMCNFSTIFNTFTVLNIRFYTIGQYCYSFYKAINEL